MVWPDQVIKYDMGGHYHAHLDSESSEYAPCCHVLRDDEELCRPCRCADLATFYYAPLPPPLPPHPSSWMFSWSVVLPTNCPPPHQENQFGTDNASLYSLNVLHCLQGTQRCFTIWTNQPREEEQHFRLPTTPLTMTRYAQLRSPSSPGRANGRQTLPCFTLLRPRSRAWGRGCFAFSPLASIHHSSNFSLF